MTGFLHSPQVMSEVKGTTDLSGVSLAFVGDIQNNVTYDLMRAGIIMGMHVKVSGPPTADFEPEASVLEECQVSAPSSIIHYP